MNKRLERLLLARSGLAMSLSSSFNAIADPCSPAANNPRYWPMANLSEEVRTVEALSCALFTYSGMSWDALAARYGVSRQALHRRLGALADQAVDRAEAYPEHYRHALQFSQSVLEDRVPHISDSLQTELSRAVEVWGNRRKAPRWWHGPSSEWWAGS